MIHSIKGTVSGLNEQSVLVLVGSSGITFSLFVPNPAVFVNGQEVLIQTYLHWNQEQGPSLYGFLTELEKRVFLLVISVSGIGPKIGLAILSGMQPNEFIKAINEQDIKALSSINGIGTKKAEQIIVHLKHKVLDLLESGLIIEDSKNFAHIKNISEVLTSLNYSRQEIAKAVDYLRTNSNKETLTFDHMLRQALSFLSKRA